MVQNQDTAALSAEEQKHVDEVTDRLLAMLHGVAKPTRLGQSLRALAGVVDGAPSIWTAAKHPSIPAHLSVVVTTPEAVHHIARDLETVVEDHIDVEGLLHTWTDIPADLVTMRVFSITEPERVVRRPVEVTPTIEEQAA